MSEDIDITTLHNDLIDQLVEKKQIQSEAVEEAFRAVHRHFFLPEVPLEEVYKDRAIPTRFDEDGLAISSSSQPAIMAIMLEQLALKAGYNVLEVGAGTGYNAALMGHLVGEGGHVTTMDLDAENVTDARKHLENAGCNNVTVVCGDGMEGFTRNAPYDAIILTVRGWEIAPAWLEQLKPDGRILLPLAFNVSQLSIAFDWIDESLTSVSFEPCGFMRLRGPNAGASIVVTLDDQKTILLAYENFDNRPYEINNEQVMNWLSGSYKDVGTGIHMTFREIWESLMLWLSLHEPRLVDLTAKEEALGMIPILLGWMSSMRWGMSLGLVGEGGMAFFERPPDWTRPEEETSEDLPPFELFIRSYGSAESLVERLRQYVEDWDADGRRGLDGLRIRALPLKYEPKGELAIRRQWHQFVFDWLKIAAHEAD